MIPVIICGGFGTKLWPISREHKPKHFIPLIGEKSLFQLNYEALRTKFEPNQIYVSTVQDQLHLAKAQAPDIPEGNYILEPEMRNQGPATGLVAAILYKKGMVDEPFMIVQSDVLRDPSESFIEMIEVCDKLARQDARYITGGFKPDIAIMGVDYLIKGDRLTSESEVGAFKVAQFVWRSNKEQTEQLIKQENALVHANHTCMTPKNLLKMYEKYRPDWYIPLMKIAEGAEVHAEFSKIPPGPIEDVTQKVHENGEAIVVELPFGWQDIGTFESLSRYLKSTNKYNPGENVIDLNGKDNFVMLDDHNKVVALIGVEDLVIVDTGDVLLVCHKDHTDNVKEARKKAVERKLEIT